PRSVTYYDIRALRGRTACCPSLHPSAPPYVFERTRPLLRQSARLSAALEGVGHIAAVHTRT
ncbi:MAG: hypothetical protein K2L51_01130, partial [Clostridiales bacterium]|nr:hypothetical protein [Clostridiales bacterium]